MSNFMGVGIFWIGLNRADLWLLAIDRNCKKVPSLNSAIGVD